MAAENSISSKLCGFFSVSSINLILIASCLNSKGRRDWCLKWQRNRCIAWKMDRKIYNTEFIWRSRFSDFREDILCLILCQKTLSREFHLNGSTSECSIWEMSKIFISSNHPFVLFKIAFSSTKTFCHIDWSLLKTDKNFNDSTADNFSHALKYTHIFSYLSLWRFETLALIN